MTTDITTPATALPLKPGRWMLDQLHSEVGFAVRHLGISAVRGRFGQFEAELVVGETLDDCVITATVSLASIDTGNSMRDDHLRAEDLLDVQRRPTFAFRSTRIRPTGAQWALEGEMSVDGVTNPVVFQVDFGGIETFPIDGRNHAGFEASGEIRRKDFGLTFGVMDAGLGDVVKIQLDMQFVEPQQ